MSVFIQFLLDNLWLVIMTGIVVLGIIGISAALVISKVRGKRKAVGSADQAGKGNGSNE